jgi:hypothetical protein
LKAPDSHDRDIPVGDGRPVVAAAGGNSLPARILGVVFSPRATDADVIVAAINRGSRSVDVS